MVDKDKLAYYTFLYLSAAMMFLAVLYCETRDIIYVLGLLLALSLAGATVKRALKYAEKLDARNK